MSSSAAVGVLLGSIFALLSVLHILWALGWRPGLSVALPEVSGKPAFTPSRAMTLAVAAGLALASWTVLAQGGLVGAPLPPSAVRLACKFLGILFILRAIGEGRLVGFFKKIQDTRFAKWDTFLFSPLCLILGAGTLWLAGT